MPATKLTIIHRTIYTFKEMLELEGGEVITSEAVQKARDWLAECATSDEFWHEHLIDTWKEALEQIGFTKPAISFSGFWSQGDGASFTSGMNVSALLEFITALIEPNSCIDTVPNTDPVREDFRPWILHHMRSTGPYCGINKIRRYRRLLIIAAQALSGTVHRTSHHYAHEGTCAASIQFHDSGYQHPHTRTEKLINELEETLEELRRDLCHAIYRSLENEYNYRIADAQLIDDAEANGYTFDRHGNRE